MLGVAEKEIEKKRKKKIAPVSTMNLVLRPLQFPFSSEWLGLLWIWPRTISLLSALLSFRAPSSITVGVSMHHSNLHPALCHTLCAPWPGQLSSSFRADVLSGKENYEDVAVTQKGQILKGRTAIDCIS